MCTCTPKPKYNKKRRDKMNHVCSVTDGDEDYGEKEIRKGRQGTSGGSSSAILEAERQLCSYLEEGQSRQKKEQVQGP